MGRFSPNQKDGRSAKRSNASFRHAAAVLTFHARCWLRAFADGKRVRDQTYTSGRTIHVHAAHDLKLQLGSAGSVTIVVNRRPFAAGTSGQVVNLHFAWRDGRLILP